MADCPWTAQTCPVWVVLVNHQLLLVSSRNLHLIFGIFLHFIQNTQLFHICFRFFFLFSRKIKNNYDITKWEGFARTQTIQSLSYLEKFVLYRHPLCLPPHFPRDWQMILDRSTQGCGRLGPRRIHTHKRPNELRMSERHHCPPSLKRYTIRDYCVSVCSSTRWRSITRDHTKRLTIWARLFLLNVLSRLSY